MSLQKNKEVSIENEEYAYYIAAALVARLANLTDELSCMVLEYCNGASTVEARKIIASTLYSKAILFANHLEQNLTKEEFSKIPRMILPLSFSNHWTITSHNKTVTEKVVPVMR